MDGEGTAVDDDRHRLLGATRRTAVLQAVHARGTVRLAELAAELGVTPVTVRRDVAELAEAGLVQRVHGGVKVPELADPDSADRLTARPGSAIASGGSLGMLVPSLSYYWPGVARGAEEESAALGLRLVLRGSVYDAADERSDVERLLDSGVSGLLLAPTMRGSGGELIRAWLETADVPHVLMERTAAVGPERRAVESVVTDHALGGGMAVHHLASLGHRRIGAALAGESPHAAQIRTGWATARAELGLDLDTPDLQLPDVRSADFLAVLEDVLDAVVRTRTTALLVHSDPEAIRLVQRAQERGLSVPGDLSVVTYDDEVATLATPALTAVRPPRRTIGRTAVTLLTARLADPGRPIHRVMVSPTLYVRASTAPPAQD